MLNKFVIVVSWAEYIVIPYEGIDGTKSCDMDVSSSSECLLSSS